MRVGDVVESARARLGDSEKTGWSDTRLIRLVNEGQKDICKLTSVYRNKAYISLANGITTYALPKDCFNVTRVEYMDEQLPIYSREDIDNSFTIPDRYATKSNLKKRVLEVLPAFDDLAFYDSFIKGEQIDFRFIDGSSLGVVAIAIEDDGVCLDKPEGLTTTLATIQTEDDQVFTNYGDVSGYLYDDLMMSAMTEYGVYVGTNTYVGMRPTNFSAFGFLTAINSNHVKDVYGVTYGFVLPETHLLVYYDAVPPSTNWMGGLLVLDDMWFQALVHYVVGQARQDDNDEGNYKIGELELAKYTTEIAKAKKLTMKNFSSQVNGARHTTYRRF